MNKKGLLTCLRIGMVTKKCATVGERGLMADQMIGVFCAGTIILFFGYCVVAMVLGINPYERKCKYCDKKFRVPHSRYRGDKKCLHPLRAYESHVGACKIKKRIEEGWNA